MPIYEYRCEQGHTVEVMQRMTDDPLRSCSTCASPVRRVFHPVAVHFKGSGFYNTDYGKKGAGAAAESDGSGKSGSGDSPNSDSGDSSKSDSGDSPKSDSSSSAKSDSGGSSSKSESSRSSKSESKSSSKSSSS